LINFINKLNLSLLRWAGGEITANLFSFDGESATFIRYTHSVPYQKSKQWAGGEIRYRAALAFINVTKDAEAAGSNIKEDIPHDLRVPPSPLIFHIQHDWWESERPKVDRSPA